MNQPKAKSFGVRLTIALLEVILVVIAIGGVIMGLNNVPIRLVSLAACMAIVVVVRVSGVTVRSTFGRRK